MTIHSSTLAWKIPRTEEPGGLQSMGSPRVGQDLATKPSPCVEGSTKALEAAPFLLPCRLSQGRLTCPRTGTQGVT